MAAVTPTNRPKSTSNRCVIEVFCGVFVLSIGCWIFCWYRGFRHRTESDLILLLYITWLYFSDCNPTVFILFVMTYLFVLYNQVDPPLNNATKILMHYEYALCGDIYHTLLKDTGRKKLIEIPLMALCIDCSMRRTQSEPRVRNAEPNTALHLLNCINWKW